MLLPFSAVCSYSWICWVKTHLLFFKRFLCNWKRNYMRKQKRGRNLIYNENKIWNLIWTTTFKNNSRQYLMMYIIVMYRWWQWQHWSVWWTRAHGTVVFSICRSTGISASWYLCWFLHFWLLLPFSLPTSRPSFLCWDLIGQYS